LALWYVLRSFRAFPSWSQIKVRYGAKPWLAKERMGKAPATSRKPARDVPRLSFVALNGQILLILALINLLACLPMAITIVYWAYSFPSAVADPKQWIPLIPPLICFAVAIPIVGFALRFDQLAAVIESPGIFGIYFDFVSSQRQAPRANSASQAAPQEEPAAPAAAIEPATPNFEVRLEA
jgi:hypothetical protein